MHFKPYPRKLKKGDLIFCEIAPQLNGYWTETVRMVVIGKLPREFRDLFEIEVAAMDLVIKALKPGAVAHDVYQSLMDFVHETKCTLMDYTDTMTHGGGLTLGELPAIRYDTNDIVKVGQSVCLHPILTFPYIGSEFMVGEHGIITEQGCKIITKRQTELIGV
jgi:Xaa-Pro aminopeptidase